MELNAHKSATQVLWKLHRREHKTSCKNGHLSDIEMSCSRRKLRLFFLYGHVHERKIGIYLNTREMVIKCVHINGTRRTMFEHQFFVCIKLPLVHLLFRV